MKDKPEIGNRDFGAVAKEVSLVWKNLNEQEKEPFIEDY